MSQKKLLSERERMAVSIIMMVLHTRFPQESLAEEDKKQLAPWNSRHQFYGAWTSKETCWSSGSISL